MEDLRYIVFDSGDINIATDHLESDIKGSFINIKVGKKDFEIFMSLSESEECNESHIGLVESIFALKRLTKFLELSVDIGFSKNLIE